MRGASYTRYHAECWAANKSKAEIAVEIDALMVKAKTHEFKWNEVGNRSDTWTRIDFLKQYLTGEINGFSET